MRMSPGFNSYPNSLSNDFSFSMTTSLGDRSDVKIKQNVCRVSRIGITFLRLCHVSSGRLNGLERQMARSRFMTNPYSTPSNLPPESRGQPRWLLRVLLLNALLVVFPAFILLVAYLWFEVTSERINALSPGDPVVFRHHFWVEVETLPATAYFIIPNMLLTGAYMAWRRRSRSPG